MTRLDTSKLNEGDLVYINIPCYGDEGEGSDEIAKNILCRYKRSLGRYEGASNVNGREVTPSYSIMVEEVFQSVDSHEYHYPQHVLSVRLATFCAVDRKPCVDNWHTCRRNGNKNRAKQHNKDACPNCVLPKEIEKRGDKLDLDPVLINSLIKHRIVRDD
ncbi:Uncharacterised protein [uncultured archaeon]|nr:Uncharacterised protein [uncultured archaeon]